MNEPLPDAWLSEDPLPGNPVPIVKEWLDEAFRTGTPRDPHACALASVGEDGRPSVRMVLCTKIDVPRAAFTMYTNRASRKGRELRANPHAAIAFNWPKRQVRIEGAIELTPDDACDAYFASRPLEARLGAWASRQSEPIDSRASVLAKLAEVAERFGATEESDVVPRPPHWGGFTLLAESVELWVSRPGRIHDRAVWDRKGEADWEPSRLQP